MSALREISIKEVITQAVNYYHNIHDERLNQAPVQNPLIYPIPFKSVAISESDREYINHLTLHQHGGSVEALDRVIITFQNNKGEFPIVPEHLRINWLDPEYLDWQKHLPE